MSRRAYLLSLTGIGTGHGLAGDWMVAQQGMMPVWFLVMMIIGTASVVVVAGIQHQE